MRRHALLAVLAAVGCSPGFDDPSTIKDLRVLAIAADTPELVVPSGEDGFLDPADLQQLPDVLPPITLDALVVDPAGGGREVRFRVLACAAASDDASGGRNGPPGRARETVGRGACPENAEELAAGASAPLAVADPRTGAMATDVVVPVRLTVAIPRRILDAALADDVLGRAFGLPLVLSFTFEAGVERVVAVKRIIFSPRLTPDQAPNQNPRVASLTYRPRRDDPRQTFDLADRHASPPTVRGGASLFVEPASTDAEPYVARVFRPAEQRLVVEPVAKEVLRFAFFTTRGTFSPNDVSTRERAWLDEQRPLQTRYDAPEQPAAGFAELFVVVRDERGGASWIRAGLLLEP